jgi:hypothetical protein
MAATRSVFFSQPTPDHAAAGSALGVKLFTFLPISKDALSNLTMSDAAIYRKNLRIDTKN